MGAQEPSTICTLFAIKTFLLIFSLLHITTISFCGYLFYDGLNTKSQLGNCQPATLSSSPATHSYHTNGNVEAEHSGHGKSNNKATHRLEEEHGLNTDKYSTRKKRQAASTCGRTVFIPLDSQTLYELQTPNYPLPYSNNVRCEWDFVLEFPNPSAYRGSASLDEKALLLNFTEPFSVQNSEGCESDAIEIRGGSSTGPLLDTICGQNQITRPIYFYGSIHILFRSDGSLTAKGFKAQISAVSQTPEILPLSNPDEFTIDPSFSLLSTPQRPSARNYIGPPGLSGQASVPGQPGEPGIPSRASRASTVSERGQPGFRGQAGSPGQTGQPGVPGRDGTPSSQGRDRFSDSPGRDGSPGAQDRTGTPVRDGFDGQDGSAGVPGSNGSSGQSGNPGSDGTQGDRGPDGAPGSSGFDGQAGGPGSPGRDGNPGERGQDGSPGQSGSPGFDGFAGGGRPGGGDTTYIQWGKFGCSYPGRKFYDGYAVGFTNGRTPTLRCSPLPNEIRSEGVTLQNGPSLVAARFNLDGIPVSALRNAYHNKVIRCALCHAPRTEAFTVIGWNSCYAGNEWIRVYHGYLMSAESAGGEASDPICMNERPERADGYGTDPNAPEVKLVRSGRGLWIEDKAIPCAVCIKKSG